MAWSFPTSGTNQNATAIVALKAASDDSSIAVGTGTAVISGYAPTFVKTGAIITPPLKNNTGTILVSETGVIVNIYHLTTGALILQKTAQVSDASGIVTVLDPLIVPGTSYAYEVKLTSNGRRLPVATGV